MNFVSLVTVKTRLCNNKESMRVTPGNKTERQILVLYASRDPVLLLVRKLLLEYAHYMVTTASTYRAFVKEFLNGDFDIVVLCSTIKNIERKKMASIVDHHSPSTPVIVISEGPFSHYDFGTVTVDPRPEAFLNSLADVAKTCHIRRSA
jgi:hypothetical protein